MIANHIHDALAQVRTLKELILEKAWFKGYSGRARIISGTLALAGTAVLASPAVPATIPAQLVGWAVILTLALVTNYAALAYWFLFDPEVRRDPSELMPALDAVPALVTGGVLSVGAILAGSYDMLFGIWMCLYGLAQVAYRQSLPKPIYAIGLFYILCGSVCLLLGGMNFGNPWPMGIVFFVGEWAGGVVLINEQVRTRTNEDE